MKFSTDKENDVIIAKAKGSLDVSVQTKLKEKIQNIIDDKDYDIVFDFTDINFIDSSCLGLLVSLTKQLRELKGDIKISNLTEDVKSIFQITRLDRVFDIHENNQGAIDAFYR